MFLKTLVYSLLNYLLYMPPVTTTCVCKFINDLFVIGMAHANHGSSITSIVSTGTYDSYKVNWRKKYIKYTTRIHLTSISRSPPRSDHKNWNVVFSHSSVAAFIGKSWMQWEVEKVQESTKAQPSAVEDKVWEVLNKFFQNIPPGGNYHESIDPVLTQMLNTRNQILSWTAFATLKHYPGLRGKQTNSRKSQDWPSMRLVVKKKTYSI